MLHPNPIHKKTTASLSIHVLLTDNEPRTWAVSILPRSSGEPIRLGRPVTNALPCSHLPSPLTRTRQLIWRVANLRHPRFRPGQACTRLPLTDDLTPLTVSASARNIILLSSQRVASVRQRGNYHCVCHSFYYIYDNLHFFPSVTLCYLVIDPIFNPFDGSKKCPSAAWYLAA